MIQTLALCLALAQPPAKSPVPWWVPAPARDADAVKMYFAIKSGSMMGPGEGWFGPGQRRHTWDWLAARHKIEKDESLTRAKFRGPPALFDRLDRDGNGSLRADDFDWSDSSPYVRQLGEARRWLVRHDADSDGSLSKAEWLALFDKLADGDKLDAERVRRLLNPSRTPGGSLADMPKKATLLRGLFNAEIGSPFPGPDVGLTAPDFTLPTADGKRQITLSEFGKGKPVVLIFGSFT